MTTADASGERVYPDALKARDWWVTWVRALPHGLKEDDGAKPTKQPVAPYMNGHARPTKWNAALPDDEHPATSYDEVARWQGMKIGADVPSSDRVVSDELGVGIIIPVGGGDEGQPVTLLDWDDVRDPETGEVHPVCAAALDEVDGFAEISQSGEGIHQFVFGEIPGGLKKFIRHIDDEPFVGDDLPMVEMYSSGRLTAMTGRHVEGTGKDVVEGQDVIDELCWRFGQGSNNSTDTPTDPFFRDRDDVDERPTHEEIGDRMRENIEFDGDDPNDWDVPSGESVKYRAVLRAREQSDQYPNTANWELIGYATVLGLECGLTREDILNDLEEHGTPSYGYDGTKEPEEFRKMKRKYESGHAHPPSMATLKRRGFLPKDYVDLNELARDDTLSGEQKWNAWADARESGKIGPDSFVPSGALRHIAKEREMYDFSALPDDVDGLPAKAHNRALGWVLNEWWDADEEGEPAANEHYRRIEAASVSTWEDVRYVYEKADSNAGREAADELLRNRYDFITVDGEDQLYVYDEETGVYTESLADVRAEIYGKDGLSDHWTTHELNEITARLKQKPTVEPSELNGRAVFENPHVCVENGVLDLFSRDIKDHSPDYYFTDRVPVEFDCDADTSRYKEFLDEITGRAADWKAMMEMVGHALVPDAHERGWKNFLILYGGADNGKSVFYNRVSDLLQGLDGSESNVMNVKLAKLASNRFSKKSMYGSMANIAGEIDGKKIRNTADIKDITGGDSMEIEPKGGDSFSDTMNTTLMFAANDPPIIGERDKEAIASRIVPVELPNKFVDDPDPDDPRQKQKVPEEELEAELATPEAMSAFLNLALDGVERMKENHGDVSLPESHSERLRRYESNADPMKEFARACLQSDPNDYLVKADVTRIYKEFAMANGYELGSNTHSTLHGALDYSSSQPREPDYSDTSLPLRPWGERKRVLDRVTLTDEGLSLAKAAGLMAAEEDGDGLDLPLSPVDVCPDVATDDGRLPAIEAKVESLYPNKYGRPVGRLRGSDGDKIDFSLLGDEERLAQGAVYRFTEAKLDRDDEFGTYEIEIRPDTDMVLVESPGDATEESAPEQAATDGGAGGESESVSRGSTGNALELVKALRKLEGPFTEDEMKEVAKNAAGVPVERCGAAVSQGIEQGDIYQPADAGEGEYEVSD